MLRFLSFLLFFAVLAWSAKPMESIEKYNVIMVHGAAASNEGIEDSKVKADVCENEAYKSYGRIFGSADMMGKSYKNNESENAYNLTYWLDSAVFENVGIDANGKRIYLSAYGRGNDIEPHFSSIYTQRPFLNPAESPRHNARELGDKTWKGSGECGDRRSLIEEAQEVRAEGEDNLKKYRTNPKYHYKDSLLPPSRNILIGHSMGGVVSREYVQGDDYKNDVDKVIALDSPHEGTGALNMTLEMSDVVNRVGQTLSASLFGFITTTALVSVLTAKDPPILTLALTSLLVQLVPNVATFGLGQLLVKDYDYKRSDPLMTYIDPNSSESNETGIGNLKNRPYTDSLPMMRLLYGKGSMTFSDPKEETIKNLNIFMPKAYGTAYYNLFSQLSGGGSSAANITNSMTGYVAGMLFGVTIGEQGTTLIPEWSGKAGKTAAFNNSSADVVRRSYDGHVYNYHDEMTKEISTAIATAVTAIVAAEMLSVFPQVAEIAKIAITVATLAFIATAVDVGFTIAAGVGDLENSHKAPATSTQQSKWKSSPNAYSKILGGQESYTPYLMEEFLYEKPFVNLRVNSVFNSDWEDEDKDTLGLYAYDSAAVEYVPLGVAADFANSKPLSFRSGSDWEVMGAKKERWKLTKGVGDQDIPIRHADRYPMPGFMVKDYIEQYEFEVDDLMPHRLRQIRINFNFNEDIGWECDVDKAETDPAACKVYKRTPDGKGWQYVKDAKHPVNRNGLFVFKPRDFYAGLSAIQKDNQNVVTISTVNKIGLTNSQRFYYMFKATADLLEPDWPYRNIKVSGIEGFSAYVSTLAYQNISAIGGKECLMKDNDSPSCDANNKFNMSAPSVHGNGYLLKSLHNYGNSAVEGKYIWKLEINTGDVSDPNKSSVSDMIIPFVLDKTAPVIKIAAERDVVNSDSVAFLARFETNEPLKFAAFFLKNASGATIAVAKHSDIIAPSFGIKLSEFKDISTYKDIENLPDGRYEIAAYAFDGSVASKGQHEMLNKVVLGDTTVFELFSNGTVKYAGMNAGKDTAAIIVDSRAPEFEAALSGLVMNKDSLLRIALNVSDINGKPAALARFSILFADTSGADTLRLGDTLTLKNGIGGKTWTEQEAMLIPDGDYEIFLSVWDEAGNMRQRKHGGILRIDRLPPTIIDVYSSQMVYRDSTGNYIASLHVEQHDRENHLFGMHCSYRINGGAWQSIADTLKNKAERQVLEFAMGKDVVGSADGLRYLEAGCRDWAGNFASKLDIFFVGVPSPVITYPMDTLSSDSIIVVRGIAPKLSSSDLPASYMLEWRMEGDALWQTEGVDIGYGKRRSDSIPYISNGVQPSIGDLGFLNMGGSPTGAYELRLSIRDCDTCGWRSDSAAFYYLAPLNLNTSRDSLHLAVSANSFDLEKDSMLSLSLKIKGAASTSYRTHLYGRDSKGALFEKDDSLVAAPYYGKPAASDSNGIWFWSEEENVYNLRWKGLPEGRNIAVHYAEGDIDDGICGAGCSKIDTLLVSDEDAFASAQAIGFQLPSETRKPKGLNRAMLFIGNSGTVQFRNQNPLWLQFKDITDTVISKDTTFLVHLGKGGSMQEVLASFLGGFQANPDFYVLHYKWDGISSTGRYPQGDTAFFYAEAVENIIGGRVLRDSIKVEIKKPALAIKAPEVELDNFNVVNYNGESVILGNKTAYYGVLWRDAIVSAYIKKADGTLVQTLFEDQPRAAVSSEKAYMLSWNGIDKNNHLVVEAGNYYFEIAAKESNASGTPQTSVLRLGFKISFAPGMQYVYDDPNKPPLLSLAYADYVSKDYWRYTPAADYLIQASASGKTLPDSLRNIDVEWDAKGTQSVQGYPPQRFSLAVKRQRETLPLVILYKLTTYQRTHNAMANIIDGPCDWNGTHTIYYYGKFNENFTSTDKSKNFIIEHTRTEDYGFNQNYTTTLEVWAVLPKDYDAKTYKDAEATVKDIKNLLPVWNMNINIPNRNVTQYMDYLPPADTLCSNNSDSSNLERPCVIYQDSTTNGYNPNANLFAAYAYPHSNDNYFLTDNGSLFYTWCGKTAPKEISIKLNLTIPNEYWNTKYGYDNLVNRTIRLDQTNKTMYSKDGYLKRVADSTDIKTFFDGKDWKKNYTYGMITPFEQHRFPFVPASQISSGNAFTFPDEDANHQYPSYYHAKFFNQKNDNIRFYANIKGRKSVGTAYDSTSLTSNVDSLIGAKLFEHGTVDIYVSMSASSGTKVDIDYPASKNWLASEEIAKHKCMDYSDGSWKDSTASEANCLKFHESSSDVSYGKDIPCGASFSLDPSKYDSDRKEFYHKTNCIQQGNSNLKVTYTPKIKNIPDTSMYSFTGDTLYIKAYDWNDSSVLRKLDSVHGWEYNPKTSSLVTLQAGKFFNYDWIREFKLDSAKALHLDGSSHTHFDAKTADSTIELSAKNPPDSLRPSEFIAIKGAIPENLEWKLSYVNLGNLQKLASGKSTSSLHEWFNVNRLQGNTSILLQWGGDGAMLNIRKLDLDIGAGVNSKSNTVVPSLFGEVSVNFPAGSIKDANNNPIDTIVTVRTANPKDYGFETSSNSALLGPVIEVLPSMKFQEPLPRIKARIARDELNGISPDRVRLYKIDAQNGKFVELQNTFIGFVDGNEPECNPINTSYDKCDGYSDSYAYLLVTAETQSFSAFAILDKDVADELNADSVVEPAIPSQIACSLPPDTLWLGLDNGWLEMPQSCNQPAMGVLQIRQGANVVAEARQNAADTLRWDGRTGVNKIAHGSYASRYIAIGSTGQEMQTLGPIIRTDTLRPAISNWSVEESTSVIDREFKIYANARDELSGIGSIRLNWSLSEAISGTVYLNADKDGKVDYTLRISRKQLAQCLGCKLNVSLHIEDKGHNHAAEEWQSGRLWPYPAELALWYPALEGTGKTAREYIGTGHDLDLLMPTPWLSASGIYFGNDEDKALGKKTVQLGSTDAYTLEAWVNPGYAASSAWRRILGFSLASGRNVELQVNGSDVRLLDGFESWSVPGLLPLPKTWTHLVVAVNADYAMFYADGKLAGIVAATPSERLWSGIFSLGTESGIPSFAGHLMQVRFYKRALEAEEALALFNGIDIGEGLHTEIVLAGELDGKATGMERGFSCAVPSSSYWGTPKESSLAWKVWASQAASYKVFFYARSAQPGEKNVKAGTFGGAMHSGVVSLESVWRPVALQGVDLPLKAGFNDLELRLPAGMDLAGIALSNNSGLQASQISWKSGNATAASSTVVAQVRFEGDPDPSMLRPRIRLQNVGNATIYGPKVRYYFRGEDPPQVQASKFYPQEGTLAVRQEGNNLGYAEWSFPETTALPSGQLLFWGEGPHFGLHNTNYVPWVTDDDPSFVKEAASSFTDAPGIIVLDADNMVLSGSCFENEEGLISVPVVQVLARDSRFGDNQASQLYIKLENIGQVPVRDYEVRYSFYVSGGIVPVLDVYDMQGLSASLKALGSGRWQAIIKGVASLGPGISWANPAQFALHLPDWQAGWNAGDDPSHEGISAEWAIAKGIEVFDAAGNRIYGKDPAWPVEIANSSSSGSYGSASSVQVRVMAKETKVHESNSSAPRFYVENLGSESISGFEVRYWLSAALGKSLGYQIYNNSQATTNVVDEGGGMHSARFAYSMPLVPGAKTEWGEGAELFVYHTDWSAWDKDSDFSHKGLGLDFAEARYIAVYDNAGKLVWGAEPAIPQEMSNPAVEIARTPDGLLISLLETSDLRLDLINVAGMPLKFLHQGILGAGKHLVPVNWFSVDIAKTYLVVRLNGRIISSQILSKL